MGTSERMPRRRDPDDGDAVDEVIRRRFRSCETMPLFADPPRPRLHGFFEPSDVGSQLRFTLRRDRNVDSEQHPIQTP